MTSSIRRREFVALLGGAAAARPRVVLAQITGKTALVGALWGTPRGNRVNQSVIEAFENGLQELGWTAGRNIRFEYRWGVEADERQRLAHELVETHPDVILASTSANVTALARETRTIPIVFGSVTDPVGQGFVTNLARPEGNLTGFTNTEFSIVSKWVEILKEIAPQVAHITALFDPISGPAFTKYERWANTAAKAFNVELVPTAISEAGEIDAAIKALASDPSRALLLLPAAFTVVHRQKIIRSAAQYRVPALYPLSYFVQDGGLISYGPDQPAEYRRVALYIDKILRGAAPSELPVQQPNQFELTINLNTAKALGLTVPPSLLVRADEVIE